MRRQWIRHRWLECRNERRQRGSNRCLLPHREWRHIARDTMFHRRSQKTIGTTHARSRLSVLDIVTKKSRIILSSGRIIKQRLVTKPKFRLQHFLMSLINLDLLSVVIWYRWKRRFVSVFKVLYYSSLVKWNKETKPDFIISTQRDIVAYIA